MDFISEKLTEYISENSNKEPKILARLNQETHQKILKPRMLSGHIQGRLLSMISKMKSPSSILEIGTFTGYGTLCLAEGLKEDGKIFTIDQNEELLKIQSKYFEDINKDLRSAAKEAGSSKWSVLGAGLGSIGKGLMNSLKDPLSSLKDSLKKM